MDLNGFEWIWRVEMVQSHQGLTLQCFTIFITMGFALSVAVAQVWSKWGSCCMGRSRPFPWPGQSGQSQWDRHQKCQEPSLFHPFPSPLKSFEYVWHTILFNCSKALGFCHTSTSCGVSRRVNPHKFWRKVSVMTCLQWKSNLPLPHKLWRRPAKAMPLEHLRGLVDWSLPHGAADRC